MQMVCPEGNMCGVVEDDMSFEEEGRIQEFRSRLMSSFKDVGPQILLADTVAATCHKHTVLMQNDLSSFGLVQSLAMSPAAIPVMFEQEDLKNGLLTIPKYSQPDLMQMQRNDPVIGKVIRLLEAGTNSQIRIFGP